MRQNIPDIPAKNVHVGDIDIAYETFGNGGPILMIFGSPFTMDSWDPTLLETLSSSQTVIVFDKRGTGNTTSGCETFSIEQFANDAAGLLDALEIQKADMLGFSLGGFIAQELALNHPDRVGKLIIYASLCGVNESILPSQDIMSVLSNRSGTAKERIERFVPLFFPEDWRNENPNYHEMIPKSTETVSNQTINKQNEAISNWQCTCDRLKT